MATATKERSGLTIGVTELKAALSAVAAAVGGRNQPSAMQCVRIGDGTVSANNRELRIDYSLPEIHGDPLLLPHAKLRSIVEHSRGDLTITKTANGCAIKNEDSKWVIPTESVAEFPDWQPDARKLACKIPADQFRRAVNAVSYAIDNDSSRYALGGVLIEVSRASGNVYFVATDGRRVSCVTMDLGTVQDPDDCCIIVPPAALARISEIASKDGEVALHHNDRELVATIDEQHTVTSVLVSGRFPSWRDVFVDFTNKTHSVSRAALEAATKAAGIVTSEQSKGVVYDFAGTLTLTARSSEYGESKVTCPIEENGTQCKLKIDPRFVVQFLKGLPEDEEPNVLVHTTGPGGAVTLVCGEYKGVIMPLSEDA